MTSVLTVRIASAQCPNPPPASPLEVQVAAGDGAGASSIGMDAQGRLVVAFSQVIHASPPCGVGTVEGNGIAVRHYCQDGTAVTGKIPVMAYCHRGDPGFYHPSIALRPNGDALVGFIGYNDNCHTRCWETAYFNTFAFGQPPIDQITFPDRSVPEDHPTWDISQNDIGTSVGASAGHVLGVWSHIDGSGLTPQEIPADTFFDIPWGTLIKECGISDFCNQSVYQPCMAMRASDGYFAVAYAESEYAIAVPSSFNIAIKVFDPNGNLIAQLTGPDRNNPSQWVNNPNLEDPGVDVDTDQVSPSASFVGDNIVVTWVGPALVGQGSPSNRHMYARRFKFDANAQPGQKLRDPNGTTEGRSGIFVVDHDPIALLDQDVTNASVALTQATDQNAAKFFIAWNVEIQGLPYYHFEIRGQYFDAGGMFDGTQFRVNQDNSPTEGVTPTRFRFLAESAQHTVAYSAAGTVVPRGTRASTRTRSISRCCRRDTATASSVARAT